MIQAVFVGDEPSNLNVSPEIPFVGAKCYRRLVQWINFINPDYYIVLNSSASEDIAKIVELHNAGFKIITLGVEASRRIPSYIPYVRLPHPSGANLQTNDIAAMAMALGKAKDYVEGEQVEPTFNRVG